MALSDIIPWREPRRELGRRNDPFNYLRSQFDRLLEESFGRGRWPVETGAIFAPQIDVSETDKEVKVCAELPGIGPKDLDINATDDELTIRGEKRSERDSEEKGRYWSERTFGSFERTIPLPAEVDGTKAQSEFKNGVLRITLPKRRGAESRRHKITVT
jgi:HSP20 family protein